MPLRMSKSNRPSHQAARGQTKTKRSGQSAARTHHVSVGEDMRAAYGIQDSRYRSASRRERHASITLALSFGRRGWVENV